MLGLMRYGSLALALALVASTVFGQYEKNRADSLALEKEHFIAQQKLMEKAQKERDALVVALAGKEIEKLKAEHDVEIAEHRLNEVKQKLEIAKIVNDKRSLLNDVVLWQQRSYISGEQEISIPPERCAETVRDCYSTIAGLTEAGQSCAIDYKYLYNAWQKNCELYGCSTWKLDE